MTSPLHKADIVIVGAGPAGLCLARNLAETGLSIVLVEKQSEAQLADPDYDGRETALTHSSRRILIELVLRSIKLMASVTPKGTFEKYSHRIL